MKGILSLCCLILLCGFMAAEAAQYPAPKNSGDPAGMGRNIQRAMRLMAESTPERRNTVRVLFYGQSITEQSWWQSVAKDLQQRYPHANLVIENRALGGFASQRLVHTAETDLYPFYPDLLIFHVYGAHNDYERIIRRTRERTTAEILIQTDHLTADDQLNEETDPAKLRPDGKIWNSFMNYQFLPDVARKYGTGLLNQRTLWKQYLQDNGLSARQLLRDSVHLNEHGCFLMAELTKTYLVYRPDIAAEPSPVTTLVVGKDIRFQGGELKTGFDGNRVDLVFRPGTAGTVRIRIDDRKPSEIPELYGFTRATSKPGGKWPVLRSLSWQNSLQLERWTLEAQNDPAGTNRVTFSLVGSKTGPDGSGVSDTRFVSRSGRVVIDKEDWDVEYSLALAGIKPVPSRFSVAWDVVFYGKDEAIAPGVPPGIEPSVTVAQGLRNGAHTLHLTCDNPDALMAIRVYRPRLALP